MPTTKKSDKKSDKKCDLSTSVICLLFLLLAVALTIFVVIYKYNRDMTEDFKANQVWKEVSVNGEAQPAPGPLIMDGEEVSPALSVEVPKDVLDQYNFGDCVLDTDCEVDKQWCRLLTKITIEPDDKYKFAKYGDAYCANFCETSDDCAEGEECMDMEYYYLDTVYTDKGCQNPDDYQKVTNMKVQEEWETK